MIKLKDIKEHFYSTACLTKNKMYNIYNVSRSGEYSNKLYLGYVKVTNGKVTHYPTGKMVDDINELDKIANEWADEHPNLYNEGNINFKHELEYYLYILNDKSLTYQDKVEVLEKKIKDRIKNM